MQPFKPYFRGDEQPPSTALTSVQKVLPHARHRRGGQHAPSLLFRRCLGNTGASGTLVRLDRLGLELSVEVSAATRTHLAERVRRRRRSWGWAGRGVGACLPTSSIRACGSTLDRGQAVEAAARPPRKYGLKGCIPATVRSVEVSSGAGISDADGTRRWSRFLEEREICNTDFACLHGLCSLGSATSPTSDGGVAHDHRAVHQAGGLPRRHAIGRLGELEPELVRGGRPRRSRRSRSAATGSGASRCPRARRAGGGGRCAPARVCAARSS